MEAETELEGIIRNHSGDCKKTGIWKKMSKKIRYQAFCKIFDKLIESGKIVVSREGIVVWVHNPKLVEKYLKRTDLSYIPDKDSS